MRTNRGWLGAVFLTAMAVLTVFSASAVIAGPAFVSKQVKWLDSAFAGAAADTTYLTDENDSTRTVWIDTGDWDWSVLGANATSSGAINAKVFFSTVGNSATATDTIYFTIEKGQFGGSPADTTYGYNGTIAAAVGSQALAANGMQGKVWEGALLVDVDTPSANNIWLAPRFRLRVVGDQSGSSPVVPGLKCTIVYPKRSETQ